MNTLLKFIIVSCLCGISLAKANPKALFRLFPEPQQVIWKGGNGLEAYGLRGIYLKGSDLSRPVLADPLSGLPLADAPGKGIVTLEVDASDARLTKPESYVMDIAGGRVHIKGSDAAGIFYGCQTLLQLLEDAADQHVVIPSCQIHDFPDIPYRAIHVDLKYHVDRVEYYYDMIDRLAAIKVNAVIMEFEDKLGYRQALDVASGNAISIDEFAALTHYARERHIEISPLVQGLGHVSFILKHDRYKQLRDDRKIDWVIDPLKEETYELHWKMYDEAMEATPGSKYFHVGGDEVYNLGRSELCKQSGLQPFELQMLWLNRVCEYVVSKGRIPIFWDDMVFSLSNLYGTMRNSELVDDQWVEDEWAKHQHLLDQYIQLFPKNCVYMRWNYNFPKIRGNVKAMQWFIDHGLQVWGASAAQDMDAMLPRRNSIFQPTKDFAEVAVEMGVPGMLQTAWDDSSPHMETYWRGFYDFAYFNWNYQDHSLADVRVKFRHRFYAPELAEAAYEFQDRLELAFDYWDTALINKGHRRHYPYELDLIAFPGSVNESGNWSERYADKIRQAKVELDRYEEVKSLLHTNHQKARRNRYHLELLGALNELQVYVPRLIVALHEYDQSAPGLRSRYKASIRGLVDSFDQYRQQYEEVAAKVRFMSNPPGFVLDQNNDPMLANGTNNSDWMHVMELAANRALDKWLKD